MLDHQALRALAAVLREGSFERGARALHLTPSAVSQRVRGLEDRLGCVLLIRSQPVLPTPEGARLYRHFLQVEMLEADLGRELGPLGLDVPARRRSLPVAVNADSLATWMIPAMAAFHAAAGDTLALQVDDQDHTREWLRHGEVVGAVTAVAEPISGCRVDALGVMPYVAAASPDFVQRHLAGRALDEALREAPMLVFNRKDELQHRYVADLLGEAAPVVAPIWWLPSAHGFLDAARAGLGWGLHPLPLVQAELRSGALVELFGGRRASVSLHWQSWRLESVTMQTLRRCIVQAAAAVLQPA
ncbi:LysR family transcriptional regulator ArgP [Sphaerotilus hippei]|nr:LysR family transcriptional regulator ArgP [Sphaerotilus hippei]